MGTQNLRLVSRYGGGKRDRTADLLHAMQALSQLSYTPAAKDQLLPSLSAVAENRIFLAEWTGLEPATPGVTGRYSNRLNYHSAHGTLTNQRTVKPWRPHGDSNPGTYRERVVS